MNQTVKAKLENVSKRVGSFQLKDIELEVSSGCIAGIIGENGAGKTTLLQIISKNKIVDTGIVSIPSKKELGFVFDSSHLPGELSAKDLDRIFLHIFEGWESDVFYGYLKTFKLPDNQAINDFSKGMEMKISIAIALSHKPKFLLLDEITSGLDPLIRSQILNIVEEYVSTHSAIAIMTTHLLDDVIRIADKVIVLQEGSIQLNKNVEDITNAENLESMLKDISEGA